MIQFKLSLAAAIFCIFLPSQVFPAYAQDTLPEPDPATYEARMELAEDMHEIRSTRAQIDQALLQVAGNLPPQEKKAFIQSMQIMLDYEELESLSIKTMAKTFTLEELQAMVNYYASAEGQQAEERYDIYEKKMRPEIVKMIDEALMKYKLNESP